MLLHRLDTTAVFTTDYSCLVLPRTMKKKASVPMFSCVPHICQVKVVSAPLFCLYSTTVFTNQPRALQLFSAAVSPHTTRLCYLASYACSHRRVHSALRSQHCRKSESLEPRITTYDSSCRCRPACMSVRNIFVYWWRDTAIANSIGSPLTLTLMSLYYSVTMTLQMHACTLNLS